MEKYSYKSRLGYNSNELLIEFIQIDNADSLVDELINLLVSNGFFYQETSYLWVNDETLIDLTSKNVKITISKDSWDCVFILGKNNQNDINLIDQLLIDSEHFKKVEYNQ